MGQGDGEGQRRVDDSHDEAHVSVEQLFRNARGGSAQPPTLLKHGSIQPPTFPKCGSVSQPHVPYVWESVVWPTVVHVKSMCLRLRANARVALAVNPNGARSGHLLTSI